MGKADNQQLPVVQQLSDGSNGASRTFLCRRCAMGVYSRFSLKCVVVLMLSVAAFLSALYCVLPVRYRHAGFDAKDSIKLSATVQAYFKLHKPVSELVPYITRLEYDINDEIGVPSYKIAVLSMHQARLPNQTDVVFGFLPDPINSTMRTVALSVLKSSFVDLFLHESNLTLTSSIFGEPSSFEILKFPDGITIIPETARFILPIPQTLFNFTLNSSIYDIKENLPQLKEQLKLGLHLMPNEVVYIKVTNKHGSTKYPPVTVEASVASGLGTPLPDRLKQLAQIITGSPPAENLGLDHSVFGKVKEISLSSFLNHSLNAPPPTSSPSPSPSPEQNCDPGPSMAPSHSPDTSPNSHRTLPPCSNCYESGPSGVSPACAPSPINVPCHSLSPTSNPPAPSEALGIPQCGPTDPPAHPPASNPDQMPPNLSPHSSSKSPIAGMTPHISPGLSPSPGVADGSRGSGKGFLSPLHASSSFATVRSSFVSGSWRIHWLDLIGLVTFLLLF